MKKLVIVICVLIGSVVFVHGQNQLDVPVDWTGIGVKEFKDSLRLHYDLQLFVSELIPEISGIRIKANQNLEEVLLDNFGSDVAIYPLNQKLFLLMPRESGRIQLPEAFFQTRESSDKKASYEVSFEDLDEESPEPEEEKNLYSRVVDVGMISKRPASGSAVLSGVVTDRVSGEPVIGATVFTEDMQTGTVSDVNGTYFMKLPVGSHKLMISYVGKKEIYLTVNLFSNGVLNHQMEEKAMELKAVVVTSSKYHNIESSRMGVSRIDTRVFNSIPVIGEVDVLKVSMLLPGVQSVGEGTTGFNVRGGNSDQNLILLDKAPVFNPSHLMGFFSAFNAEVIRDFELHKSVIPPKMGGRLSSVMELNVKSGNKNEFGGSIGVSPLTGNFHLEGPLVKDKLSFLIGGRSTYSDWILKRIDNEEISRSSASFRDMNIKLDYKLNDKHSIRLSAYYSDDDFSKSDRDTVYEYTNKSLNLEWKYKINPSLIKTSNLIYSSYNNSILDVSSPERAYKVSYNIDYYEYRSDFIYFLSNRHLVNFGLSTNFYKLLPGKYEKGSIESIIIPKTLEEEQAMENSIYLGDEFKLNSRLTINAGIRYTLYNYLGPKNVFVYADDLPIDLSTLRDTVYYDKWKSIASYHGPEPRLTLRYILGKDFSVKAGYSRMRQNIHIMSNTFSVSPTDTWKLSDTHLTPQVADQFSVGVYRNFKSGLLETSLEAYYKDIKSLKDYKVAATLMMNEHIETEIIDVEGKAYGMEFLLRKPSGKLNGWLSYTYSRILEKSDGEYKEEQINDNEWFPAVYDKPHSLSVVGSFRFTRRFSISSNLVYSTGRPITYPVAKYNFRDGQFLYYSDRNAYRVDDYFRWDIALKLDGNLRVDQIAHSFWSLSVYNLTGRDNVYSVYFVAGSNDVQGYKMSVFAEPIVSLSYNFRF